MNCMNQCMRKSGEAHVTREVFCGKPVILTRERWFCATDGALPTEARCRLHHVLGVEIDVGRGNGDGSLSSSSWPAYLPLMDALKLLLF